MATKKITEKSVDDGAESSIFGYCPECGSDWLKKDGHTTNVGSRKQRYLCKMCELKTTAPLSEPPKDVVSFRNTLPKASRYIVTAAQNATDVHMPTLRTLERMAKFYDAPLVVIPGRYKNPTSQWSLNNKEQEWWAPEVVQYLYKFKQWTKLNERLVIAGDMKVEWASHSPLVGLDALTKDRSGIVGHGSRGMRTIATPQHKHPKRMFTTGTVTVRNYTDTKRGRIAAFNHCLGALIVEIDGDTFYVRQLNATKFGNIVDLELEFTPDEVRAAKPALAVSMGDSHVRWIDPGVVKATFTNEDSLVNLINPRNLFWHDIIDFHARNWHHEKQPVSKYAKWKFGKECVRTEIEEGVRFVNKHTPRGRNSYVVSSNHERGMDKWLDWADWRDDPVNGELILEANSRRLASVRLTGGGVAWSDSFIDVAERTAKSNVKFLKLGESKMLSEVEYGFHGDIGPNGSRGTTKNLSKLGVKVTKGHSHTAEIVDGCYSAGKSTGMLEYEMGGPSSHDNSHVVQYFNGKRTIVTAINGRYCLPRPPKAKLLQRATKDPDEKI